jgi:hypothetical protein
VPLERGLSFIIFNLIFVFGFPDVIVECLIDRSLGSIESFRPNSKGFGAFNLTVDLEDSTSRASIIFVSAVVISGSTRLASKHGVIIYRFGTSIHELKAFIDALG